MSEPPLTAHTKCRGILPTSQHHNKGKKHVLACAETLQRQKKGIETCFSAQENLTATKKACKHVFVGTKIYYGPNQTLHPTWADV
jgi:hypothetical protein